MFYVTGKILIFAALFAAQFACAEIALLPYGLILYYRVLGGGGGGDSIPIFQPKF